MLLLEVNTIYVLSLICFIHSFFFSLIMGAFIKHIYFLTFVKTFNLNIDLILKMKNYV